MKKTIFTLIVGTMLVCSVSAQSQIVKGLRLARLTTAQRDQIQVRGNPFAEGQTIYNTDNDCHEYWNGKKWVSLCLGTANIALTCEGGGAYSATDSLAADGRTPTCTYTPQDSPPCTVPNGQAYQVYLTAGGNYATLIVEDATTSGFYVQFEENNTAYPRFAVVRVVNNCSGEFSEFPFIQKGSVCPAAAGPTVTLHNSDFCWGGAAYAYINNPENGVTYLWERQNNIVHTGTSYEITSPGTYHVYAGLIGCGTPAVITVNNNSQTPAPAVPRIVVENDGIICGASGSVKLTAVGASSGVYWFKDGIRQSATPSLSYSATGEAGKGEWYAIAGDADCASLPSNRIQLSYNAGVTSLADPVALVNGVDIANNALLLCSNGTVKLTVANHAADYADKILFTGGIATAFCLAKRTRKRCICCLPMRTGR